MDFRSKIQLLTQTGLQSHLKDSNVLRDLARPSNRSSKLEHRESQPEISKLSSLKKLAVENAKVQLNQNTKAKRPLTGAKSKPVISLQ